LGKSSIQCSSEKSIFVFSWLVLEDQIMCRIILLWLAITLFISASSRASVYERATPLTFTENLGQWDKKALFRSHVNGATVWFAADGVYQQFTRRLPRAEAVGSTRTRECDKRMNIPNDSIEVLVLKVTFVGANPLPNAIGEKQLAHKYHYFLGNNPDRWHTNVPSYAAIRYEEVYPQIDVRYHGHGHHMEYDFVIAAGADPSVIRIRYEGTRDISVNDNGDLVVETAWNRIIELKPVAYQLDGSERIPINAEYTLYPDTSVGFALDGNYDPALPTLIDPIINYSTYLGGSEFDLAWGIAVDNEGYIYIAGATASIDFPTESAYQDTLAGINDVLVSKLNAAGDSLIYSTYLGGTGIDEARGIAVDTAGCVYTAGWVFSNDFPTVDPFQTFQGGDIDGFAAKLSPTGDSLIYSTYLGSNGLDALHSLALDSDGHLLVTGETYSPEFPVKNELQPYRGSWDVFVTKFNTAGNGLVYSTWLGGSDIDDGHGITVDDSGNVYVTGFTYSTDFPLVNAYQSILGGVDVFVAKISSSGEELEYSTFLGGGNYEKGLAIQVDSDGQAYVAGFTYSTDFPTRNPFQTDQGMVDNFVSKLSSSGDSLIYSTYLGGSYNETRDDYAERIGLAIDTLGHAVITGGTFSEDFPTKNALQSDQPLFDAYVTKLTPGGDSLIWSTYLGGEWYEEGYGAAIDQFGHIYVTGRTSSSDFPTVKPYQQVLAGGDDVFIVILQGSLTCCIDLTGNLDGDASDIVDIGDLTALIAYLYIPPNPAPPCMEEANIDGDTGGLVDIADLTALISYLYIPPNPEPAPCQ
jgi:hypothetical protein